MVVKALKHWIILADPSLREHIHKFSGQSIRISAASSLAHATGDNVPLIQSSGDWKSAAYELYCRLSHQDKLQSSLILGQVLSTSVPS